MDEAYSRDGFAPISSQVIPRDLAVGEDGSVVIVGETSRGWVFTDSAWATRYSPSGESDQPLPLGDLSQFASQATAVDVGSGGSILVGARDVFGDEAHAVLLDPNGAMAAEFGDQGVVSFPATPELSHIPGVALVGARALVAQRHRVLALDLGGEPDPSFAEDGILDVRAGGGLATYPDDRVLVAGSEGNVLTVTRVTPDGTPDPTFADDGTLEIPMDGDYAGIVEVALSESGQIALVTSNCVQIPGGDGARCEYGLRRVSPDGLALATEIANPAGLEVAYAGEALLTAGSRSGAIALGLHGPDGALVPSFGTGGVSLSHFGLRSGYARDPEMGPGDTATALVSGAGMRYAVGRFELGDDGVADADADSKVDSADSCPHYYAGSAGGCPRVPRRVRLLTPRRGPDLIELRSLVAQCVAGQRVRVLRRQPGRDPVVARVRIGSEGEPVRLRPRLAPGTYFAAVRPHLETPSGFCTRAQSKPRAVR